MLSLEKALKERVTLEMVRILGDICEMCEDKKFKAIDHNHSTNKIRGLVCGSCNAIIGVYEGLSNIAYRANEENRYKIWLVQKYLRKTENRKLIIEL